MARGLLFRLWLFLTLLPDRMIDLMINPRFQDGASVKEDARFLAMMIVVIIVVIIGASIYFTITTPAGQTGLAGLGLQLANGIAAPFIAFGNGIATFFSSLFGGIGSWFSHHLVILPNGAPSKYHVALSIYGGILGA